MTREHLIQAISDVLGPKVFAALVAGNTGLPRMLEMAILKRFAEIQVRGFADAILQDAWKTLKGEGYLKFDDDTRGDATVDKEMTQ